MRKRELQVLHEVFGRRGGAHPALGADGFEEFLERNPSLLDSNLIRQFYSRQLIVSESARAFWSAPDRRPLPALVR